MKRVVLVGAGGIGAPFAIALAASRPDVALEVVDDDRVELTNLHRQILFTDADVGRPKLDAFAEALARRAPGMRITTRPGRALPSTAAEIVAGADVVVDATDNFASRFLLADACRLAGVAVVHAASVRLVATVMASSPKGRPCYRCLFEDLPTGDAPDCATAGVLGPVCGVAGAIAADRAVRVLDRDASAFGHVVTFAQPAARSATGDALRVVPVKPRAGCPLCGDGRTITGLEPTRYAAQSCDVDLQWSAS